MAWVRGGNLAAGGASTAQHRARGARAANLGDWVAGAVSLAGEGGHGDTGHVLLPHVHHRHALGPDQNHDISVSILLYYCLFDY